MMLERSRIICLLLIFCCWAQGVALRISAAESVASPTTVESNTTPHFNIQSYVIEGNSLLSTNITIPLLVKYTGTNTTLEDIVKAAIALQSEYFNQGYPGMSVAFAPEQISNGIVTLNVFQAALPQIVVAGNRFLVPGETPEVMSNSMMATTTVATNVAPIVPVIQYLTPATSEEMAKARADLLAKMAAVATAEKDTRIHVVSTNAGPRFDVEKYYVTGNSVLPPAVVGQTITNIDGAFGTNVSFDGVRTVVEQLQQAYKKRGYVTVAVDLPQQKLTNAMVKVQVLEGRLAAINVTGNRYFSSNNVMRALPSLHTNTLLNGPIFQAELNRANANQDRQIYPLILPGPLPGTSALKLTVEDRLPLHAKLELNNQNAPGTPDLRVNSSAVLDNLWQLEHSLGLQYGFSPEMYKLGNQWDFYDQPLVANYGAFYRMPLGNPEPLEKIIAGNPGDFGYSEATRQFRLPPPSGQPELNLFASRSTVDTGLLTPFSGTVADVPGFLTITRKDVEENLTVNNDIGTRLSVPASAFADFQSSFSGGLDFKTYNLTTYATNNFLFSIITVDPTTNQKNTTTSTDASPNNAPPKELEYLPLSLRYDATWRQPGVVYGFGLGVSGNVWYSALTSTNAIGTNNVIRMVDVRGARAFQAITGSSQSTGYWVAFTPNFSADFTSPKGWMFSIHANGQWASEPLISTEQFGIGGVNSVRGYHEGEVFGDTGWRLSLEQQTPPHIVGMVYGNEPLTIRGSVYMDCGKVYLLDPQGRPDNTALWSTGVGLAASVASHWEARFLLSLPLIGTSTTPLNQPVFNFDLTAQF